MDGMDEPHRGFIEQPEGERPNQHDAGEGSNDFGSVEAEGHFFRGGSFADCEAND